jgi:predicted NAD-dependent protein-ADP-ribosyltransferase YbiA (DUF1768 family)
MKRPAPSTINHSVRRTTMDFHIHKGGLVLRPDGDGDASLASWGAQHAGQVFRLRATNDGTVRLHAIGPEDEACRVPINITSRSPGELKLISNFAAAHFTLDGLDYASVEGFWQGLKFPDDADRRRLAALVGSKAKDAGYHAPKLDGFTYAGATVRVGTWDHWQLMEKACLAKFEQCEAPRAALLSTGRRPLVHQVKPDSRSIPGVIMADIWMRIRAGLQARIEAGRI